MRKKSVVRSIEILALISQSKEGLSLNDLVEQTSIPKTTAYEILLMLLETGMIQAVEGKAKLYQIGLKAFVIGHMYLENMDLVTESKPIVTEVSQKLNKTAFIAVLEGTQIIYLYKHEPDNVPIYTANIANREDAYCTSLGKAIMAFMPGFDQEPLIKSMKYRQRTPRTIMSSDELRKELKITKERGYSIDNREILDFVLCQGAPIFNHKGRVVAAISTAGLYSDNRDTEYEGNILVEAADKISCRLGYIRRKR